MKTNKEIIKELVHIIQTELNRPIDSDSINDDTQLGEEGLFLDSLSIIELIMNIESTFEVQIPDEEIDSIIHYTIGQLVDYIRSKITH
jgi:acyl carrier protein